MQTIDYKAKAIKMYPEVEECYKQFLEELFGAKTFLSPMDRIKTFEDACEDQAEDPKHEKFNSGPLDEIAYRKLKVIARALNNGWKPEWNDSSQYKWWPWFYMNSPGFRFGASGCACLRSRPAAPGFAFKLASSRTMPQSSSWTNTEPSFACN